jgi:holo-[acyl-carrier protein] synthase
MIVGIGVDLCDVGRLGNTIEQPSGPRFVERVFTDGERAYCEARKRGRVQSYAARFAAKEAAMKALGTGWGQGVGWRDVEVVRVGDDAPTLVLHGEAARLSAARGVARWLVTLSHTDTMAIAWVIAEAD